MLIQVAGLIGAGKSTVVSKLATNNNFIEFQEPVETNDFLELYYKDAKRWSFAMQINLLFERYKQTQEAFLRSLRGETAIIDSSIYSDMAFALVQQRSNLFTPEEFKLYCNMHKYIAATTAYPDILFWLELKPNEALERINKRARGCESDIKLGYLTDLYNAYQEVLDKISKHTKVVKIDAQPEANIVYKAILDRINNYKLNVNGSELIYN